MRRVAALLVVGALAGVAQEVPADPCESLLASSRDRAVWPGHVVEALSGDTLRVRMKTMGLWNVRLAGLRAPAPGAPLAAVSRHRLARLAKGLRVFLVLDALPRDGSNEVVALVEDFTEAQLEAGLGWYRPEEEVLLGAYVSCRSRRAEERARQAHVGLWSDAASSP